MVSKPGEHGTGLKNTPWDSAAISEDTLQRLDRLANLGTLSAGIAHEIKNGLVPIRTFIELMLQKSDDPELAATVEREIKRIDSLVGQMLRFAAPKPARFAPVKVHDVLEISLKLLQHQISHKMISVNRDFQAEPAVVRGDESQLQQVMMNLLLNALEAMGVNGALGVATEICREEPSPASLKIHIRDNGSGISEKNLQHLFEPFFTTKRNGTGLGLAISQRIAYEHHGKIHAHSEAGKGSTFTVLLPLAA